MYKSIPAKMVRIIPMILVVDFVIVNEYLVFNHQCIKNFLKNVKTASLYGQKTSSLK